MRLSGIPALAVLAVLALVAAGCGGGGSSAVLGSGQGQVQIRLAGDATSATLGDTGAPSTAAGAAGVEGTLALDAGDGTHRQLQSAAVTFSSILARNLDGQLVPVTIDLPVTVDVLALDFATGVELPIGFLPPGDYDQMVVVMTAVDLVLDDGTAVSITPPGGGWTSIVPTTPFTVEEGATTAVQLRFRKARAFRLLDGSIEFHPEFEMEHD